MELLPDAIPCHQRACLVAHIYLEVFKTELQRLCDIVVLQRCGASKWASPTFNPKRMIVSNGWVSGFRDLNKVINRNIHPLPRLQTILTKRAGYLFFTKLDVSTQYYTFALVLGSQNLCVILSTPFGLYKYLLLPMGVKQSSDIAQETME